MIDWQGSGKILVVDDEDHIRSITELMLVECGFDVETANDGLEAVSAFERQAEAFDLVILDLTMPRMGGQRAFDEIRRLRPDVGVLLTSGYGELEAEELLGEGPTAFLQKPFELNDLLERIQGMLSD